MFEYPSFIVLDIPSPVADKVQKLRDCFDPVVAGFPVEITVVGSSGIGTLSKDQDKGKVFKILDELAKTITPFCTSFKGVARFPETDIFYLVPNHPEKLADIQKAIATTETRFDESPFPYTPHCTIRSFGKVSDEDIQALLSVKPPNQEFCLDMLSVYELVNVKCNLLHRIRLTGNG